LATTANLVSRAEVRASGIPVTAIAFFSIAADTAAFGHYSCRRTTVLAIIITDVTIYCVTALQTIKCTIAVAVSM